MSAPSEPTSAPVGQQNDDQDKTENGQLESSSTRDATGLGAVPDELRTPFRDLLVEHRIIAASFISRKRLVTHLVLASRRALCGVGRPSGEVSDMTKYAVESQVCAKCLRVFRLEIVYAARVNSLAGASVPAVDRSRSIPDPAVAKGVPHV